MVFYNYLLIPIVIFILATAAGFLFNGKLKLVKYILWVISILFFIYLFIITPISYFDDLNSSRYLAGTYSIDIDSSKYHKVDMRQFASLKMVVKDNHTFYFDSVTPFFERNSGDWFYWVDGEMENVDVTFDEHKKYEILYLFPDNWIFSNQLLLDGKPGDRIVFKMKK